MRFTVTPGPGAEDTLAWIWLFASDRQALAAASNRIDAVLMHNPMASQPLLGDIRKVTVGPLTALYRVSEEDRLVTISDYIYHG
jgi:hypothetical protein